MSNGEDDLRGSTPIYTAKDILVALDRKVGEMDVKLDGMNTAVQIIVSQNLNERVLGLELNGSRNAQTALSLAQNHEQQLQQWSGARAAVRVMFGTSVLAVILGVISFAHSMGWL